MSTIFGVPVDAVYYVVSTLAAALTPLTGGLAVAVAIVLSTVAVRLLLLPLSYYALRGQVAQSRLAPQLQALRQRHHGDPDRLTREARALYRDHGTSMFAGYLPLLLQWPLLSVMYLLFRSRTVGGAPNTLLRHHLFTALFGAHWLTAPGPLSGQGAVFAGLFALLIVAGYLAVRASRRLFPASAAALSPAAGSLAAGAPAAGAPAPGSAVASSPWLARLMPLLTLVFAAFLPLAGVLCLLTTAAWTLLERRVFARYLHPADPPVTPRPANT
jgi:YidC/Oxa1 family membrane protein insertase